MRFLNLLFLVFFLPNCFADNPTKQSCASVTEFTCQVASELRRGINLGNMLEAPREGSWGVRIDNDILEVVSREFSNVRVPIRWSNHASIGVDAKIDEDFANRVDQVIDTLLASNIYVIINVHHYSQLFGDNLHAGEYRVSPEVVEERLLSLWRQIANRYKNRSDKLIFELLNEPHGKIDSDRWNKLHQNIIKIVRDSNPTRIIMVGPMEWNSPRGLSKLGNLSDKNLIIQIHNYDPFEFTHQGVSYLPIKLPIGISCCSDAQRKTISDAFDTAQQWSKKNGYPIYLGEFGVSRQADVGSRGRYIAIVRDEAEKRGFGWSYWELASSFGVFDAEKKIWNESLRRFLLD